MGRKSKLDDVDHYILDILQRDADLTNKALAERIGLTEAPLLRRVQVLKEKGYIKSIRAILDPDLLGIRNDGFVIDFISKSLKPKESTIERIRSHKAVYQLLHLWETEELQPYLRAYLMITKDEEYDSYMRLMKQLNCRVFNVSFWDIRGYQVPHINSWSYV